ncbi:MAG: AmmeMemoRadiSam system protein A [Bacillota bacterium]
MGEVIWAGFLPHPPIIVPEVGGSEALKASATVRAVQEAAKQAVAVQPEVLLCITPHGPVFSDAVAFNTMPVVSGSLAAFGAPQVRQEYKNCLDLVDLMVKESRQRGIQVAQVNKDFSRTYGVSERLDHGCLVPLYFMQKAGWQGPVIPLTIGMLPAEDLYSFGVALKEAIARSSFKVAVLASGDLSHCLKPGAPAGYSPAGERFDQEVVALVRSLDVEGLVSLSPELVEKAAQCGLPSLIIMLGVLDGRAAEVQILGYEGPFGVGYLTAAITPGQAEEGRRLEQRLFDERRKRLAEVRRKESFLVRLAREALETYLRHGRIISVPADVPPEFRVPKGVFVSLKKHGQLRGCIGTVEPTRNNVAEETIHNALEAGSRDPRFNPVEETELAEITYSVDVLEPPEPADSLAQLDPRVYGIIVRCGRRTGLLLPDLEGVDTAEKQVEIAKQKAGIRAHEKCELERFKVVRHC